MMKIPSSPVRSSSASTRKRIATHQLKPGMFLVGVYQSWWKSPFFRHHRLLKDQKEVDLLLKSDIKKVMIDISRGLDVSEGEQAFQGANTDEIIQEAGEIEEDGEDSGPPILSNLSPQEAAEQARRDAILAMENIFEGVKTGDTIDHPRLQHTVQSLLQQVLSQGEAMVEAILIQNLRQYDKALYGHVVDVAVLSIMVGVQLGLDEESLEFLALGGLLHDVGHVRIPRNLLRRKHNLVGDEQTLFERHVELGLAILKQCPTIPLEVHRVVAEHHERQDGSGYPSHLTADGILSLSDIVGFIDQFDGLVSQWGTPPCVPTALAIRKLYQEAKSGQLRTVTVEALIRCLGVYPLGSLVSLSTGERAVVVKTNALERLKPTVKILSDREGKLYDNPITDDLSVADSSKGERTIRDILNPIKYKIDVGKYFE